MQQLCYVVEKDGNLTERQLAFIDQIIPLEDLKATYVPCVVDPVKAHPNYNNEFLDQNKLPFMVNWAKIALQNPI